MPLNKTTLGTALYNFRNNYCNKTLDQLVQEYGTLEAARLAMCIGEAEVIINHFKANGKGKYMGGLTANGQPVVPINALVINIE